MKSLCARTPGRRLAVLLKSACAALAVLVTTTLADSARGAPPNVAVRDVQLTSVGDAGAEVRVTTSAEPHFSARVVDQGKRLIVDIDGSSVEGAPPAITKGNAIVAGVMTQGFKVGEQRTVRVLVQLAHAAAYRVRVEPTALAIELARADVTAPMAGRPAAAAPSAPAPAAADATLTNVRF